MGHPGKCRTKCLMRCYVYWPNMDRDIADMIESCKGCALAAKSPTTTSKPWPKADHPWQRIHVDFAVPIDNIYFLIVVDSHSKWPKVLKYKRQTTNCTIGFLHEQFVRFGVVDCVVTDNATQFTSSEFRDFCKTYHVDHITTPQYHPRSNGKADRFVETLKLAIKKALGASMDRALQQFLHVYRITSNPNTPIGRSPAETMFARKVKSVSLNSFHGKQSSRKLSRPIRNISILAIKFISSLQKHDILGSRHHQTKDWRTDLYCPGTKTHPQTPYETASGNAVWMNLRNHHKIPANCRSTQYSIISISTRLESPEVRRSEEKEKFTQSLEVNPKRRIY